MYKCEICGRVSKKKERMGGYTLCSKHMHQLHKYGRFLDNNPRTNTDLNDYTIAHNVATFNVYNQKNEFVTTFCVDLADIELVKYHKWRVSHNHIVTGQPALGEQRDVTHVILGLSKEDLETVVVDHIDGNPTNNCRSNLRVCTQGQNVLNKSFMSTNTSGFIGVSYKKDRGTYDPDIRLGDTRCHLGARKDKAGAVYARYIAESIVFGEFANDAEHMKKYEFTKDIPEQIKREIEQTVKEKLKNKKLWQ